MNKLTLKQSSIWTSLRVLYNIKVSFSFLFLLATCGQVELSIVFVSPFGLWWLFLYWDVVRTLASVNHQLTWDNYHLLVDDTDTENTDICRVTQNAVSTTCVFMSWRKCKRKMLKWDGIWGGYSLVHLIWGYVYNFRNIRFGVFCYYSVL